MSTRRIASRVVLGLFLVQLVVSAVVLGARPPMVVALVRHLGYPDYFPVLLGIAKLLAAVGIVQPWWPVLTEWAYAGVTFELIAAAISHAAAGDAVGDVAGPLVMLVLCAAAYVMRRRDRLESGDLAGARVPSRA